MIKSPLFHMGNKYDLMEQLIRYFPKPEEVRRFYDVFGGSGAVSINVGYKNRFYSEKDAQVAKKLLKIKETSYDVIMAHIEKRIEEFGLPYVGAGDEVSGRSLRESGVGETEYYRFRDFVNERRRRGEDVLLDDYVLSFYSFCNLSRYNSKGDFNMPYGKRAFSYDDRAKIYYGQKALRESGIDIRIADAFEVLRGVGAGDFVYCDPPYTNTCAVYQDVGVRSGDGNRSSEGWSIDDDLKLFKALDEVGARGARFALSNVSVSRGVENKHLLQWAQARGYEVIELAKNYASLAKGNSGAQEVLIVNYSPPFKVFSIFDF